MHNRIKKGLIRFVLLSGSVLIALVLYKIYSAVLFTDWGSLWNDIIWIFNFPGLFILIFIPYFIYVIVQLLFYLLNKYLRLRIDTEKLPLHIVIFFFCLLFLNLLLVDFILFTYNEHRYSGFSPILPSTIIDSTNFKSFEWERKSIEYHGNFIVNENFRFKNDSTIIFIRKAFVIPDNSITSDLLIKYLLNSYDYESENEYLLRDSSLIVGYGKFKFKLVNGRIETDLY